MSRKWNEVADHRLRVTMREPVIARRFWIGFATACAILALPYLAWHVLVG